MRPLRDPDAFPEPERYELKEAPRYHFDLSRRTFLGITGTGLLVLVNHEGTHTAQTRDQRNDNHITARLHLGKDGRITLMTSKVEVGQGSRTQIAQAAAEELR